MTARERQRVAEYKRRLKRRLARQPEDEAYAGLLRVARLNVLMETSEVPYDEDLAAQAETLARLQWPPPDRFQEWPYSVHVDRLTMDVS